MNKIRKNPYPNPTQSDHAAFIFRLYFGAGDDALARAINRAHRDLSRTVQGIGEHPEARPKAVQVLVRAVSGLPGAAITTQAEFDGWHRKTCAKLSRAYASAGYKRFTVGQSQKWLNMTLKYVFVFGEARLPGYKDLYRFCHVPIDNIILNASAFVGLRKFKERWARIADYTTYLTFQRAVRKQFPKSAPLAVEFWVFQGRDVSKPSGATPAGIVRKR